MLVRMWWKASYYTIYGKKHAIVFFIVLRFRSETLCHLDSSDHVSRILGGFWASQRINTDYASAKDLSHEVVPVHSGDDHT